jgi:hypothetical protein
MISAAAISYCRRNFTPARDALERFGDHLDAAKPFVTFSGSYTRVIF